MTANPKKPVRLLSRREVMERVGVSYPTLWSWMRENKFPRSREIGGKVAWLESEVDKWITDLPVVQLKGDLPPVSLFRRHRRPLCPSFEIDRPSFKSSILSISK